MQTFELPVGTDLLGVAIKQKIADALDSLRSTFAGASAPSSPIAYQLWADTTSGYLKIRNAANSAWIIVGSLAGGIGRDVVSIGFGAISATTARRLLCPVGGFSVSRVVILSDTATTGSSGANEWRFALKNETTGLQLFSGTVGTGTTLSGVGGGAEIGVNVGYILTPNQNATMSPNDVLSFTFTKQGTPTSLTYAQVQLEGVPLA